MSPKKTPSHVNREISWLSFNARVLQEADDTRNPLVERVRFLGIFSNNLDEFFQVRVASLRRMALLGREVANEVDDPEAVLSAIHETVIQQQDNFERVYDGLMEDLRKAGIRIVDHLSLDSEQTAFVRKYFAREVRARLVPIMLDRKAPFPELKDGVIYFAVKMVDGLGQTRFALMEIPDSLPRFVVLPSPKGQRTIMYLDDVIRYKLRRVFALFDVAECEAYTLKITRDAELDIDDDISQSLIEKMAKSIARRKQGEYVRFVFDETMPDDLLQYIVKQTGMDAGEDLIPGGRYHNKRDLMSFPDFDDPELSFQPQPPLDHPAFSRRASLIREIFRRDVLLNFPYQKFDHIVDLLREAAIDPRVRRIRINLYRVARNSHIINALVNAAKNGKKVTVIIELQARFDEKNNIHWSNKLQENGIKVIFGVPGLKVHSKLLLLSLREDKKSVRIAHIGTGNFHERTARVYSDMSLLTADRRICNEVKKVFDFFENNYQRPSFRHLIVSPYSTRRKFVNLINAEIRAAKAGQKSWIILKLNNLVDQAMIRKLHEAGRAGVQVKLIIRGVCSLIPGVKGTSDNIEVTSIVGRYLEHSRIMSFCNGGDPLYFISSADWMTRNLDHRIEVTAPIYDVRIKSEITQYLNAQFKDNVKARRVDERLANKYITGRSSAEFNSQERVYEMYREKLAEELG